MIKSPKAKGASFERRILAWFLDMGFTGRKQPMSGALNDFPHDLQINLPDGDRLIVEVKKRARLPLVFEKWLGRADVLVMAANNARPDDYRIYLSGNAYQQLMLRAFPRKPDDR